MEERFLALLLFGFNSMDRRTTIHKLLKSDYRKLTGDSQMLYETKNKKYSLDKKCIARQAKLKYNNKCPNIFTSD